MALNHPVSDHAHPRAVGSILLLEQNAVDKLEPLLESSKAPLVFTDPMFRETPSYNIFHSFKYNMFLGGGLLRPAAATFFLKLEFIHIKFAFDVQPDTNGCALGSCHPHMVECSR